MRRRLLGAFAVLVVAAAGLGLLFPGRQVHPGTGAYQPASTDPIQAALPVLRAFVEQTRGLTFTQPVSVTVLDAAGFARVAAEPLPEADGGAAPDRAAPTEPKWTSSMTRLWRPAGR